MVGRVSRPVRESFIAIIADSSTHGNVADAASVRVPEHVARESEISQTMLAIFLSSRFLGPFVQKRIGTEAHKDRDGSEQCIRRCQIGCSDGPGDPSYGTDFSESQVRMPFDKCRRFSAWAKAILCDPSMTPSVTSSPRRAGRQCMNFEWAGAACTSFSFT